MARSPIIGITAYNRNQSDEFHLPGAYVDAVQAAGGISLLIPPNQPNPTQILAVIDGLILSGGGDIEPSLYGGSDHPTLDMIDLERDQSELALAELALATHLPTLGICRGMQILNVASGGNLVTHVPEFYGEMIEHRLNHPRRPSEHSIQIDRETRLAKILKVVDVTVVSWHHQALRTIPNCWKTVAWAADGLVEAIEHQDHPWLIAVQWHPEMSSTESPHGRLFRALVEVAGSNLD